MFTTILLPSDFSGCSAEAARAARRLVECFGSRLIVLHVLDEPAALDPMFRGEVPLELLRGRMEQYAREGMEAFLKAEGKKINVLYAHNDDMAIGAIEVDPGLPIRGHPQERSS